MKKTILIALFIQLIGYPLYAQKFELNVNLGTNLSFIPNFTNPIEITSGGCPIPGLISRDNSFYTPILGVQKSETTAKPGFFIDLELSTKLSENMKLSFACGLNQMKFSYDSYVDFDTEITTWPNFYKLPPVKLRTLDPNYGNTNLLYINLRPLNLSLGLFNNTFTLQCGPSFNFLINSKQNNKVILYTAGQYDGQTTKLIDKMYFDSTDDLNKILFGLQIHAEYKINKHLEIFISGQNYFNSIFKKPNFLLHELSGLKTYNQDILKSKALQIQTGLSYILWNSGKKNN